MTKVIIFTDPAGTMCIMYPAPGVFINERDNEEFRTFSDDAPEAAKKGYREATIEDIAERDVAMLGGDEFEIVEQSAIPQDNYFRKAWQCLDGEVYIDMEKAVEVHKENLRIERGPILAELDLKYMRADEDGNSTLKNNIAQKKQALRDITNHPDIDAATMPDELKFAALTVIENAKGT